MHKITRREFLKNSLMLGASFAGAGLCPHILRANDVQNASPIDVSVVKGENVGKITREALDLIGGVKKIVAPGQTVFIKPNYIAGGLMGHDPVTSGEIPHPEVVAAVAEECVKQGAKSVIIGEWFERPLQIEFGGREGKDGAQVKRQIELINKKFGEKIYLVDLRRHTKFFKYVPSNTKLQWLAIPNPVMEADVVISVAVLKTHHWPIPVTFGMKNFVGIMPSVVYGEPRMKLHEAGINQIIVDINKGIKPKLTVISGIYGMEGEGVVISFGGKPVIVGQRLGAGIVIAGYDPVATDATATRIITKGWKPRPVNDDLGVPWYVSHLRLAFLQGLGEIRKSKITVKGCTMDDIAMGWQMPGNNTYPELPNNVL
ncbi:MAG: DUF362 domain-containing protein [Candidatus Omnitrophica bacterium]|nr:DUF362 domain-containing protein [Candidatus Omnitrophota bacterium]MBU4478026.1 DUF362 domain-containing protein [Candidatus Omnitrophota bacterium]MCG2703634.1 DUF362 domain-containing protein [Candidatus Omnitrophota bacterium]